MLDSFATWLKDVLLWVPRKLFQELMEALASVINAIPVPSWFNDLSSTFGSIPSEVWWLASVAEIPFGLGIVGSAYFLRFLIRRLPIVG